MIARDLMSTASGIRVGIIGGSGLYQMPELTGVEEVNVDTPFGPPSDAFIVGTLEGQRVAFLPRHGRGHRLTPTEVPFRANIYAMKLLGVESILSGSAVGSLQEKYAPLDMVIPDQFFDRTRGRVKESTFFGEGIVAHVSFAHPVCGRLGDVLEASCGVADVKAHRGGTYLCMEGPAFSSVAESNVYRSWGMDIIGMTNLQEAKLAREAEICYATMALVTDYDCWHEGHDDVSIDQILGYLRANAVMAQTILRNSRRVSRSRWTTPPAVVSPSTRCRKASRTSPRSTPARTRRANGSTSAG